MIGYIIAVITALIGSGGISWLFYYSQIKRIKSNQADALEIANLTKIIAELRTDRDDLITRVTKLELDEINRKKELVIIERELYIYKRAESAGIKCDISRTLCPIAVELKQLKSLYLHP